MLVKMVQFIEKRQQINIWSCDDIFHGQLDEKDIKEGNVYLQLFKGAGKFKRDVFKAYLPKNCIVYIMNDEGDTIDSINRLKK